MNLFPVLDITFCDGRRTSQIIISNLQIDQAPGVTGWYLIIRRGIHEPLLVAITNSLDVTYCTGGSM